MTQQWADRFDRSGFLESEDIAPEGYAVLLLCESTTTAMQQAYQGMMLAECVKRILALEALVKQHHHALADHGAQLCNHRSDINLARDEQARNSRLASAIRDLFDGNKGDWAA